ncbi:MAG: GYF domain-containing protein, partial [Verrucomicrobiia bacterium]
MQITINRAGDNHGPYSIEQARELLTNGTLQDNDLAHYEGAADWLPLKDVPGLRVDGSATSDVPPVLGNEPVGKSKDPEKSGPATFPCTGCGGDLLFKPGAAKMECPYCGATVDCPAPTGEVLEHDFESQLASLESGATTTVVAEV